MPIRLMVGCLLLKRLYDLGDESLAKTWVMNPYMQYFCGRAHFEHQFPCDPSDLVHFRHRIGEAGVEKIFNYSVEIHGDSVQEEVVLSDTTVQENNITYPTDAKLYAKIIDYCRRIAQQAEVEQRQSYVRVSKQHLRDCYNAKHPSRAKKAKKARKKLRTIGYRVVRELERKIPEDLLTAYQPTLDLFTQVLNQEKKDKNKIYSLHKFFTACIAKGKAGRPYEYGNKVGLMVGK